jgi:hypothetical protein
MAADLAESSTLTTVGPPSTSSASVRRLSRSSSFGRVVVFDACYYLLFRFHRRVGEINGGKSCCRDAADKNERY